MKPIERLLMATAVAIFLFEIARMVRAVWIFMGVPTPW